MKFQEKPLVMAGTLMAALIPVFAAAMWLDPRLIEGAPAWLKPWKFAVSTAIYSFTLAWSCTFLPAWPRVRRVAAWTTAIVFVVEVALIAMQAWRGVTSHFNTSTIFDGVVFGVMGTAIGIQTIAAVAVAVALWRQRFEDRALGWALRLGLTITVLGAFTGPLMTTPTKAQLELVQATHQMPRSGAHTVGAPDGGPGLTGTGWSVNHGDIRVPHFIGLHAMQVLPLALIVFGRRRRETSRVRFVIGLALSYVSLFAILLAQALSGQSVIAPQGGVLTALIAWALATVVMLAFAWRGSRANATPATAWSLA